MAEPALPKQLTALDIERDAARATAALLTAAAHGPLNPWSFVAVSDFGLGLFARTRSAQARLSPSTRATAAAEAAAARLLRAATSAATSSSTARPRTRRSSCRRAAPRMPTTHRSRTRVLSCGRRRGRRSSICDSTWYRRERTDRGWRGDSDRLRVGGDAGQYWDFTGISPQETAWRTTRLQAPPPTAEEPLIDRLAQLQAAAAAGADAGGLMLPDGPSSEAPLPWQGTSGGDARLRVLVPLLYPPCSSYANGGALSSTNNMVARWAILATHLPGRSGRECRERWALLEVLRSLRPAR